MTMKRKMIDGRMAAWILLGTAAGTGALAQQASRADGKALIVQTTDAATARQLLANLKGADPASYVIEGRENGRTISAGKLALSDVRQIERASGLSSIGDRVASWKITITITWKSAVGQDLTNVLRGVNRGLLKLDTVNVPASVLQRSPALSTPVFR